MVNKRYRLESSGCEVLLSFPLTFAANWSNNYSDNVLISNNVAMVNFNVNSREDATQVLKMCKYLNVCMSNILVCCTNHVICSPKHTMVELLYSGTCVLQTLGTNHSRCLDYQSVLIFQISL